MTTIRNIEPRPDEPPTSDEMLAYLRHELSAEDEARFRDRLIEYPELVRTLAAEFPSEGAELGDDDYMSDEEFARHRAALQKRMSGGAVVHFWPAAAAVAATIALVLGGLFWRAETIRRQPNLIVMDDDLLMPGSVRGAEAGVKTLIPRGDQYVLVPVIMDQRLFESYRIEMRDTGIRPTRSLWSMVGFHRNGDSTLLITVPRSFLGPGTYQLALYGTLGAHEELVGTYMIRIPESGAR
jgi:hypothetical protein